MGALRGRSRQPAGTPPSSYANAPVRSRRRSHLNTGAFASQDGNAPVWRRLLLA
ncbi:hypothetical protein ACT4R9_02630 [Ornithobacterium rhinotracheale]|uniref:hypothetical protein n=1 Tax=Ornithobacterium rhinotracheale TaxID=28251 RepID=UPI003FD2449B